LLYTLQQGQVEQIIIKQCLQENIPFPDPIANAPDLLLGLSLYYLAFLEMSNSRGISMTLGPIPWYVINQYCESYGIAQKEEMHYHINAMDSVFLEHNRKT
jgi:hypothetical protein